MWFNVSYGVMEMACSGLAFLDSVLVKHSKHFNDYPYSNSEGDVDMMQMKPKYECFRHRSLSLDP